MGEGVNLKMKFSEEKVKKVNRVRKISLRN